MKHLHWLAFEVPKASVKIMTKIKALAKTSSARYPVATSLTATLATYSLTLAGVDKDPRSLLLPYIQAVRDPLGVALEDATARVPFLDG